MARRCGAIRDAARRERRLNPVNETGFRRIFHGPRGARTERVLRRRLAALPRLRRDPPESRQCKICNSPAPLFDVVDFNKVCDKDFYSFGLAGIPVIYYRCQRCGFIFTDFFDTWSGKDFVQFIYNNDYLLVDGEYERQRPERAAAELSEALSGLEGAHILDYGSGAGHFAEAMRARGFSSVTNYDPFSAPERPRGKFQIITCLETIEHSVDPLATMEDMRGLLAEDGAIILGQSVQPADINKIRANWWYIAPRNGHVSFFAENTFVEIADRLGLVLYFGSGIYGFSRPTVSAALQTALRRLGRADVAELSAPEEDDDQWNGIELSDFTRFRWTRSAQITWPPRPFPAGSSRIRISFLMEAVPGFAKDCQVFVGNEAVPTAATANAIIARPDLPASAVVGIRLVTPDPPTRHAVSGSLDERRLGLAIPVARAPVAIGGEIVPHDWPVSGEAARDFVTRLENGFFARYLAGEKILDIGFRGYQEASVPILPRAIGVDLGYPGYDGITLPFSDGSIDAVFSSHMLEHAADYQAVIRDWYRVLKIGGFIVCIVPHQFLYEKKWTLPSRWNGDHKRFYTPGSLLDEFEAALAPNTYRVRHLVDNDKGYTYDIGPDRHCGGACEIELVIEKIRKPAWDPDP
jgi:2-polyprenyl-3-methyl-5-hydroxy-6-metoxy-1,4-benzoquinol methylase